MSISRWRVRATVVSSALLAVGLLAGCGGGSTGNSGSGANGVLTVTTGAAGAFVDDFNPFSPNVEVPTNGMIYEPLFFFNTVKSGEIDPWLGTGYTWSDGGRTLNVRLRHGVKWTDGTPFTSADVVFTLDLAKGDPSLNRYALPLAEVKANGQYGVTVTFTKPAYSEFYFLAGKTMILPRHLWQSVPNPATFLNTKPVGTGAFTLSKVQGQVMELRANPHYYLPGLPKLKTIRFLSFNGNDSSDAAIESGQVDWAGSFIPNVQKTYLGRDPQFALTNIPLAVAFLVPNLKQGPTTDLAVRQAISAAINRSFMSNSVYNGNAPATNPEALLTPNYDDVLDPGLRAAKIQDDNPAKAKQILQAAGYQLGADGIFDTPSGQPLTLSLKVVSGYTDYVSDVQIIAQEARAAGIDIKVQGESFNAFTADQDSGNFQLIIDNFGYTPLPYSYYDQILDSRIATPIGQTDTVGNYGRYSNPEVDSLLSDIAAQQNEDDAEQDFYRIEQIFAQDLPDIPLFEQQDEIEFNGNHVSGFPTTKNPYGAPAVYVQPDIGWVAMRLAPAA
ncbi:MAG TPA: ABC transporter substrate-binding protein [Pseudonocardiaceae bacterium]|jgi:peptide/nickel transport system substrate-binding protein